MAISPGPELTLAFTQSTASSRRSFTIGQLAKEFGLTLRALRFYEDRGLLTPTREGRSRIYSAADRERLRAILKAKALGFTLADIKETLGAETPQAAWTVSSLSPSQVEDQIAHLEQQRAELIAALTELRTLRLKLLGSEAARS